MTVLKQFPALRLDVLTILGPGYGDLFEGNAIDVEIFESVTKYGNGSKELHYVGDCIVDLWDYGSDTFNSLKRLLVGCEDSESAHIRLYQSWLEKCHTSILDPLLRQECRLTTREEFEIYSDRLWKQGQQLVLVVKRDHHQGIQDDDWTKRKYQILSLDIHRFDPKPHEKESKDTPVTKVFDNYQSIFEYHWWPDE